MKLHRRNRPTDPRVIAMAGLAKRMKEARKGAAKRGVSSAAAAEAQRCVAQAEAVLQTQGEAGFDEALSQMCMAATLIGVTS
jgi:hypothetical protein